EKILSQRKVWGAKWLEERAQEVSSIGKEPKVGVANALHSRIVNFPPFLSKEQQTTAASLASRVEKYLKEMQVEWLVEKFYELDEEAQGLFMKIIEQAMPFSGYM
ncbi:MAG TPA: hypothetical protein PK364_08070, partial [Synergistaceae bacterium]|nr:hypothetical protein [Synergistaceae bacterium]